MTVKIYVEGGGDHNKALRTRCRQGFSAFFEKAGLEKRMPSVVVCGGRQQAYEAFQTAHLDNREDRFPILLVDSEAPVTAENSWGHVKNRVGDGWTRPQGASDDQLHFMVQAMEAWFYADKEALQQYYKNDFHVRAMSPRTDVEDIPKAELFLGIRQATKDCRKGEYSKGAHSFEILSKIDPARVRRSSAHADRLLSVLDRVCTLR